MKIGIIGTPQTGKSTIFQLLTNTGISTGNKANTGIAKVPDERIDILSKMYDPKKTTYAAIEFVDIAGMIKGQSKQSSEFLNAIRDVDALVQVVRAFESASVPSMDGKILPMRDIDEVQSELILTDWALVDTRIERLEKQRNKAAELAKELPLLQKCKETLEKELPLRTLQLNEEEEKMIRGFDFFTKKPLIIVVNVDDEQLHADNYPKKDELETWAQERGIPVVKLCGQIEMEINQLEEEDKKLFMEELGLEQTGIERLAQAVYNYLGLISFFTVGTDEVKAWTIEKNSSAKESAGKIHSDIERGFIRAEVVNNEVLITNGSTQAVKEKGLFRLEGKDYIVQDGDIINFRFNV